MVRSLASFPQRVVGVLRLEGHEQWLAEGGRRWPVRVLVNGIPLKAIAGTEMAWLRETVETSHITICPERTHRIVALEAAARRAAEDGRRQLYFGCKAFPDTSVGKKKGIANQAREIGRLAMEVDKPAAWAEVASCWYEVRLRPVVEQALRHIGFSKVLWVLKETNTFTDDLVSWVEDGAAKERRTGGVGPWHPDDHYLLDDS